jgi:hypothetical protein
MKDHAMRFEPNERYRTMPGAMLRLGNLPKYMNASVHSGEDVIPTATGPGSERVPGQLDSTEVFRVMAEALALGTGSRFSRSKFGARLSCPLPLWERAAPKVQQAQLGEGRQPDPSPSLFS